MNKSLNTQIEPYSSNAIRLSVREWLVVAGVVAVASIALPVAWQNLEDFVPSADYRIPYDLSEDYWLYSQYSRSVSGQNKTLLIGDSVMWGHYVGQDQTLSHHLNELAGAEQFVNMGLDGSHPLALLGLIKYYARDIRDEDVILHMNLLWLSSPEADLQTEMELDFNHPRLVPQFRPSVPCYAETVSGRISILLERVSPLLKWTRHLQSLNFDNSSLQVWTLENPYSNPLGRISLKLHGWGEYRDPDSQPRTSRGQILQSLPWVSAESSLQWWAFRSLVNVLDDRGNRIFVIVGPLNEHTLDPNNKRIYRELLGEIEKSLQEMNLDFSLLPLLPGTLYADTSHPMGEGYSLLAEHIWIELGNLP
jgi:hypothetical protein